MTVLNNTSNIVMIEKDTQFVKSLKTFSKISGLFTIIVGLVVIAGWTFNISTLKSVLPSELSMKANAALLFILSGISFIILLFNNIGKLTRRIGQIIALVVFTLAMLTIIEYIFNQNFGIDQIIFEESKGTFLNISIGRMSANTAFGFLFISLSLLFFNTKIGKYFLPSQVLSLLVVMLALMGLTSHFYSRWSLLQLFQSTAMSFPTAFLFFIISLGILLSHPYEGFMKNATKENSSGIMLRYLFPAAILLPVIIELLATIGAEIGLYEINLTPVARTLGMFFSVVVLLWFAISKYEQFETKQRKAEEEVRILNEELEKRVIERTKELESFSYSVSHDLRAPIRAIDGFSRKLAEQYESVLNDEGKRLLNIVLKNTRNMGQLIDDLLTFSRLSRKKVEIQEINMMELVNEVLKELTEFNEDRKLDISVKALPNVKGDRTLMRQVIVNLLSNSIKFTKSRDTAVIEVGGFAEDNLNSYYVKDNGVGFDMKYVDKAFEVFQRLHSSREFEGTGVGLAIVHKIIQRHSGEIWAGGEVDKGATFYFSLPG
jgi:signal transduction histidine kinase